MKKQVNLILVFAFALTAFTCQKETEETMVAHNIAIWTIKDALTGPECPPDRTKIEKKEAFLLDTDILTYHTEGRYFTLTAAGINKLKEIKTQTPFCLTVDNRVVYTGYFMPGYLSLACFGIIIDPLSSANNTVLVRYQYAASGQPVDDQRNNTFLLKALEEQGKLRK